MTINVGDYVEVVKWPCCGLHVGHKFVVGLADINIGHNFRCKGKSGIGCGANHPAYGLPFLADLTAPEHNGRLVSVPAAWCRKLPPLAEPEIIESREEIAA